MASSLYASRPVADAVSPVDVSRAAPTFAGGGRTQAGEDTDSRKRERNRINQQRCRERRRKLAETKAENQLHAVRQALLNARRALSAKCDDAAEHRRRLADAVAELASLSKPPYPGADRGARTASAGGGQPSPAAPQRSTDLPRWPQPSPAAPQRSTDLPRWPQPSPAAPQRSTDLPRWPQPSPAAPQRSTDLPRWPQWAPPGARRPPRPCAIFEDAAARAHRHTQVVTLRSIGLCPGVCGGMEAHVDAFRARTARALGCDESDILWLVESERFPAVTQSGGIGSSCYRPDFVAKATVLWMACQLDATLRYCITSRLETHVAQLRHPPAPPVPEHALLGVLALEGPRWQLTQQSAPSPHLPPSALERLPCEASDEVDGGANPRRELLAQQPAPPDQRAAAAPAAQQHGAAASVSAAAGEGGHGPKADSDLSAAVDSIADLMHGVLRTRPIEQSAAPGGGGANARAPNALVAPASACSTVEDARALTRCVVGGVVQSLMRQAHPADVLKAARQFRRHFSASGAAAGDNPHAPLTMGSAYSCIVDTTREILQDACARACAHPVVPELPTCAREVEDCIAAHYEHAAILKLDFLHWYCHVGRDRPEHRANMDFCFLSFRRDLPDGQLVELRVYEKMQLTKLQKMQLAQLHSEYRRLVAALDSEQVAAVRALERLLAASDIPAHVFECAAAHNAPAPYAAAIAGGSRGFSFASEWAFERTCALRSQAARQPPRQLLSGLGRELGWARGVLGASGEATAAAGAALEALQQVQRRREQLRMRLTGLVRDVVTPRQQAILFDGARLELGKVDLCAMAAEDLRSSMRRAAICQHLG